MGSSDGSARSSTAKSYFMDTSAVVAVLVVHRGSARRRAIGQANGPRSWIRYAEGLEPAKSTETKGSADHAMRDPRSVLRIGIGAYLVSFLLVAISTGTRGHGCAIMALLGPFIALDAPSGAAQFFDGNPFGYVAMFVSGLVNIAFPLAMFLKFKRYDRSFAAARIAVLVTIPFSWIVFVMLPVLPREGHVLWVSGMLLALFSEEIAARRRASASSRGQESSAPHSGPARP
jgi:hypothetical protein